MWRNSALGGDVREGRARVGVEHSFADLLETELNVEIADILDLDSPLGVLFQQHSSHTDKPILRLDLHLRTHSFALHLATHRVLFREELDALLESLLLDGLELDDCPERLAWLHFLEAVEDVKGAEYRQILLLQLSWRSRVREK
jgi:hypothetical protein